MKNRNNSGFTLVEVVVVVAVIAILAAVLTPYITKYIDDSKIAKAKSECQVISAAVANFYKDVAQWPRNPRGGTGVSVLYTGGANPALPNTFANFVSGTATAGWDVNVALIDTHLVNNNPAPSAWPTTGDQRWNGPYASVLPLDPWGRPYLVYIPASASGNAAPIWVVSAGPDGTMTTAPTANSIVNDSAAATFNDDIGIRLR